MKTQQTQIEEYNIRPSKPTPAQASGNCRTSHSPLPWQALDWMILCDKVNKYGNFYVAEVSTQFLDAAGAADGGAALDEAKQNIAFIVRACNKYEQLVKDVAYWQKHHDALQRALNQKDRQLAHAQRLADALEWAFDALDTPELRHARASQKHVNAYKAAREALAQWEGLK